MLYSIIFARYVGAELKGTLAYISSIVATGSIVLSIGIHHAYPYYRKNADDIEKYKTKFVSTSAAIYCVYLFLAVVISIIPFSNRTVCISALLMVLWSYNRVEGYVVLIETPNKRNRSITIFTLIEAFFTLLLYFTTNANFYLGLLCMSILEICKFIYFTFMLKTFFKLSEIDVKHAFQLFKYGFLPMLALLMTTLNYRIDVIMLKNSNSIMLSEVGVYSIGVALTEKVLLLPDAIQEILLSRLAKKKGAEEVASVCRMTLPICIMVALAIIILGKPFLDIFYGLEYSGAYIVTVISITGTLWMIFFKMISQYNIVNRKQAKNVLFLGVAICINITLNLIFVPIWKINGAAFATAIGNAVCAALFVFDFSKTSHIPIMNIIIFKKADFKSILNKTIK